MTSDEPLTGETLPSPDNPEAEDNDESGLSLLPPDKEKSAKQLEDEKRLERRERVWHLRIVDRKKLSDIAEELGVSVFTVHADCKWVESRRAKSLAETDRGFIVKQDEIYEALLTRWLPVAMRENAEWDPMLEAWRHTDDPALKATDKVIKAMSEQAKLHGFGQAGKASAKDIGKEVGDHVLQLMQNLASGFKAPVKAEEVKDFHTPSGFKALEDNTKETHEKSE